ncbi:MAG: quinolinate synthase NadA [Rikenellaceae bacterium]
MAMAKMEELKREIERLKREKNCVILAHYYTRDEVQEVADFVGDSLALARVAQSTDAAAILFAGVHFMAETAKILSPQKMVLLPDMEAGCSLADSCKGPDLAKFKAEHPDHMVVSYVNTTAEVKALTDVVCTSSNAIDIVNGLPADAKIIFGPDRNLGSYVKSMTGRDDMLVWDGACHVHERFSLEKLVELKKEFPNAKVVAHPECKKPILMLADHVGSTAALLDYVKTSGFNEFIVVTEPGILFEMQKVGGDKIFHVVPPEDSTCACNDCSYMKLVTLEKIYESLRDDKHQIEVAEDVRVAAEKSIIKMLAMSK